MTRYLKNMDKEITIANQLNEITRIARFIEELGLSLQLPPCITMGINLAIEEAITNIITHGYSNKLPDDSDEVTLRVHVASGILTFIITDNGISFDPMNQKQTNDSPSSLTLEQRLTEGLGIFIIRRTMDEVDYQTIGTQNQLTLIKRIDMKFEPEATLKTNICKIEDVTILTILGRLDTVNSTEFSNTIQPLLVEKAPYIIINCEGMSYISSSGIRNFIILQKSVTQYHGQLVIEAMQPEIQKIFDMTGCSTLFTIR